MYIQTGTPKVTVIRDGKSKKNMISFKQVQTQAELDVICRQVYIDNRTVRKSKGLNSVTSWGR
jgi:hypothetical protein